MTFAIFNLSGNIPIVSIWFTMSVIGLTRFSLIDLSKVFDNPSHPVLFLLSKSSISLLTKFSPMSLKVKLLSF